MVAAKELLANIEDECFIDSKLSGESQDMVVRKQGWKILIADDEDAVHRMTRMVLHDYRFESRGLDFLSAYSGEETIRQMQLHPDAAIILLDVVMETDDAGLRVVQYIRESLKNEFVRIILRTGYPGKAPEMQVISKYDINDYKEKTELTAQKLYTTITSALRTYRDLRIIDQNRRGLEKIIDASADLFEFQSLRKFAQGVLMQLVSIFQLDEDSAIFQGSAFTASQLNHDFIIIAGTGVYENFIDKPIESAVSSTVMGHLSQAITGKKSVFMDDMYAGFFTTKKNSHHLLYLKGCRKLDNMDKNLISIFSTNVAVAFENIALNKEIIDTQKEVIFALGEILESRSLETGNHVRRVAELSYLLALKAGLDESEAELLRMASPMHDVGKVGIPDSILLNPGKLSPEEFAILKHHTEIGYQILKNSHREIMEAAVVVARQHHECWDGSGYPNGLKGEQIHIFGRITALVDVFDALLHRRVYKDAWEPQRVQEYIEQGKGKQFDPDLVDIMLKSINEFLALTEKFPGR